MPRLRIAALPRKPAASAAKNTSYQIGMDALAGTYKKRYVAKRIADQPFKLPEFPPEAMPPKNSGLAMDETPLSSVTSWAAAQAISSAWSEGLQFLGYTYLSELAQRAEYRVMSEVIAEEMTRKWIRFQGKGDKDKTEKISELTDYLDDMKLQAIFHKIALTDGLMGRAHIYIDTGQTGTPDELQTPIGNGRDDVTRSKLGKGKLRGFKVVEPIWSYPLTYNASDPLADDWYRPDLWYCMSRAIHRSRLLTFVGRPVPDILKPAYAFGGLSLSQMAKPYVDNWLRTRQSVSDLVHSFTVFKLGTDLSALLMDQGDQLFRRMELFNNLRDNNNLFLHDKDTEDFENTSAPLGTLDALLNKSQEQMASVARIPIIKLLGIQPGGLNASSEGEIVTFYDTIAAGQERLFRPHLTTCIDFAQISLWGEVDTDIVYVFEPLRALSRKEESEVRKADAEIGQILVTGGVISQEEERIRVASDPDMPYQGLDPADVPDLQEEEEEGLAIPGAGGAEKAILETPGGEEAGGKGDKPKDGSDKPKEAAKDGVIPFDDVDESDQIATDPPVSELQRKVMFAAAEGKSKLGIPKKVGEEFVGKTHDDDRLPFKEAFDAEWSEADHDRQPDGKFGSGGSKSKKSSKSKKDETGGEFFQKNWHKAGSVGGHSQPSKGQIERYTKAWEDQGKPAEAPASAVKPKPLKESELKRVGKQMGSNPGGVFEDKSGQRFYVKQGKSKSHVDTELAAADLYKLAGTPTLDYQAVEGGKHIATKMQKLDADRLSKLSPADRKKAQDDFVTHAWLANWDAVGLGGDNIGTINGVPTALDLGGALTYRAQGAPKGAAFGNTVGELDTLRSKGMNPDAASLYGSMTDADMKQSAQKVLAVPDSAIWQTIEQHGLGSELADKLIARKKDIAKRLGAAGDDAELIETEPDVFALKGKKGTSKFEDWENEPANDSALDQKDFEAKDQAMDEFSESKHPRVKGGKNAGQFAPGGGKTATKEKKEKPKLPEGVKSKKEHVGNLLKKGVTAKEVLAATGWPSVSMPQMAKALGMTLTKKKEGGITKYYGDPIESSEVKEPPKPAKLTKAEAKKEADEVAENASHFASHFAPAVRQPKAKPADVPKSLLTKISEMWKAPQATPEELKKASKATKVPSTASPVANKAIDLFNAKYANTPISSPEALNQKVADYKKLQTDIAEGMKASQAEQAAAALEAVKKKAEQEKAEAEAAAKEANDPKIARHYEALKQIFGYKPNLTEAKERIAKAGLTGKISPVHASAIIGYTQSHYGPVNKQMRTGAMTQEQWNYAKSLNAALDQLPPHIGVTQRGSNIPANELNQYQPGIIIEERAFTSTGKGAKFSGNVSFEIHGRTGRDVSKLSSHQDEKEVLFKSGTRFKVVSRSGNHIVMHEA